MVDGQCQYLKQLRDNFGVLCCEAHVHTGGELQGVEMPALLSHEVIDLVHIQALLGGLKRNHTHIRLPTHLQPLYL